MRISIDRTSSESLDSAIIAHTFPKRIHVLPFFPVLFLIELIFASVFLTHITPFLRSFPLDVHFRERAKVSIARNHAFISLRESHRREITDTLDEGDQP